jgi:hypothetical protein
MVARLLTQQTGRELPGNLARANEMGGKEGCRHPPRHYPPAAFLPCIFFLSIPRLNITQTQPAEVQHRRPNNMLRPIARQRLFVPATALTNRAITALRAPVAWRASSSFPIADPGFWRSLVPKPFRRAPDPFARKKRNKLAAFKAWMGKDWNPATFFIFIFLLIGSMSINMITLKKGFETYMRQSDVRIGLLREVVEKLQKGEKVDVERVLGTGVPEKEAEWEEGMFSQRSVLGPRPLSKIKQLTHMLQCSTSSKGKT